MDKSHSEAYRLSGVDITAGYESVRLMKKAVESTFTKGVVSGIGGFGGLFSPDLTGITHPVLVSGTDGVGTKLRVAMAMQRHDTIGIDCVAMCVNDIICCGAKPLFFLDYIACGHNVPEKIADIVSGVAAGCVESGCALVGGETAEMPDSYPADEYDLAGFAVGIVDRDQILDKSAIGPGCTILALPSTGVHSNGFSLVRKVFRLGAAKDAEILSSYTDRLGEPLGDILLRPTAIYVNPILALLRAVPVLGISHITGGGFFENIPRCLPEGISARIDKQAVRTPEIFRLIAECGGISEHDMFNTFNMGVGMCAVVETGHAQKAIDTLQALGMGAYVIGETVTGEGGVEL